jgi:ATP-dependent Clp protease protease subunit
MTKFEKDWVEAYFDRGIDIANRRIFLDSDIEADSVGPAIKGLYLMETESKTEPIEMFISSYGGTLYEALALYDILNTIKCPISTFAYGKCMSAAPVLLAAGEQGRRWVAPHTAFMHHDMSFIEEGTRTQHISAMKHVDTLYNQWISLLAKYSNKDKRWWDTRSKMPADFYFTAEDALEWGLADHIWVEKE